MLAVGFSLFALAVRLPYVVGYVHRPPSIYGPQRHQEIVTCLRYFRYNRFSMAQLYLDTNVWRRGRRRVRI